MKTILFAFSLLFSIQGNSQSQFNMSYGTNNNDQFRSICQTPDSGFAFFGHQLNSFNSYNKLLLVRTNKLGQILWSKIYSYINDIQSAKILCNANGEFYLLCTVDNFSLPLMDIAIIKTAANGDTLWTKKYGGMNDDWAGDMIIDSNGDLVIAGTTASFVTSQYSGFVIKTDSSGGLIWSKIYAQSTHQEFNGILNTNDGKYLMCGYTQVPPGFSIDGYAVKTDTNGNVEWSFRKGITSTSNGGREIFYHASQDNNNDIYFAGSSSTTANNGTADAWMVKINDNATSTLINYTYGTNYIDEIVDVLIYPFSSTIVLAGYSGNSNGYASNTFIPVDANSGTMSSTPMLAGNSNSWSKAQASIRTLDGSFAEAGAISLPGHTDFDAYVVKYSSIVSPCQFIVSPITEINQLFNPNYVDSMGTVETAVMPSTSTLNITTNSIVINTNTICATPVNVTDLTKSFDVYITPNPVSSIINVNLSNVKGLLTAKIIDINGRIVLQTQISNNAQIPVSSLKAGLYQLKIEKNNPVYKRFVKID